MQNTSIERKIRFPEDLNTANLIISISDFAENYFINNYPLINKVRSIGLERLGIMPYSAEDLARRLLSEFWFSGWKRLKSYRGEEHLDSWLIRCCCQMLYPIFVDEGVIRSFSRSYRSDKYSIRWEEMFPEDRKKVISLLSIDDYRKVLEKCYIDLLPCNKIAESYPHFDEQRVKNLIDDAESTLISILLNCNSEYCIYIVTKGKRYSFIDIDTVETSMGYETEEQGIWGHILELLKSEGGSDDYVENLRIFIIKVTTKAHWDDMETKVVLKRLIYKESPVSVAMEFGVTRAYIDNYYSVRRRRLIELIRNYWR